MIEYVLKSTAMVRLEAGEVVRLLHVEWHTAKCYAQEFSRIFRAMRKGSVLLQDATMYQLDGKCVTPQVVTLLRNIVGLEFNV